MSSSASPRPRRRPANAEKRVIANDDPPPPPPVEPALEDCCGSGCDPCIFDLYEQARERYRQDLQQWQARQAARRGA